MSDNQTQNDENNGKTNKEPSNAKTDMSPSTQVQPQNTEEQKPKIEDNQIPEMPSQDQSQQIQQSNAIQPSQNNNNNQVQPQQNQSQNSQIQPSDNNNNNTQVVDQQANQSQNNQVEQNPQVQPQIVIEKKINFTHPMNNYCSEEKIKELEASPPGGVFKIVNKRFEDITHKLENILNYHERYTLYKIYYKLNYHFALIRQYGKDPQASFLEKDPKSILKISDFDFSDVLQRLNCQLTTEDVSLILKSLRQKTNTLYSYDEFMKNVYNIKINENGQMKTIYQQCRYYFDDYIYSYRHYIQDNKIDYKGAFDRACPGMTILTYEYFQKFLNEIGLKFGHDQEKLYLFNVLCDSNIEKQVSTKTLFDMAELSDISEEDFIKSGVISFENVKVNTDWIKNIKNYTEGSKDLYKKNYESFEKTFKKIHEQCKLNDINNLTNYFAESGEEITPDGDIDLEAFNRLMTNIGVAYNIQFDTLITQFKDNKRKPKTMFKLADFLSIYNLFVEDDDNNNKKEGGVKFEEEEDIKGTNVAQNQNVEYVFKNAHRQFTQDDINYLVEICQGIADIIIEELNDSVTNFFQKKDKRGGYLFLKELKDIFENELKIELESESDMDFNIFFDFVKSDKMVQNSDIVIIKKLIQVITFYSGKDGPQKPENQQENNINESNQNNKVDFKEEDQFKGENNPNPNEREQKPTEVNIERDKEDEINTDSHKIDNIQENIDNKKVITEIINTNINTSSISFDKIIADFAHCLYNRRIRFNKVFPSINLEKIINNQTISEDELKRGFRNTGFDLTPQEFSVVMTHFDPINKKKALVEDLKHEIAKYEPKYFNQSYQKIDPTKIKSKLDEERNFPPSGTFQRDSTKVNLLNGMNKIQSFLIKNNISPENFLFGKFSKKNRNENLQIDEELWKKAFIPKDKIVSDFIPYLEVKEVNAIYKEMDPRLSNSIILSQIINFFNKYMKKNENLIHYNDQTTLNDAIKNELKILFDYFDVEHKEEILFDNFYKCLKSVDHKATKKDASDIVLEHTKKNPSTIGRNTFNEILFNYIQKLLFIQREEKDYIMNLFREADIDKNGYLTRNQIKYLMKNKINCGLTDIELDEILDKVDTQNINEIDIRDFVFLLDNINNTNLNNSNMINTMSNVDDNEVIPIMNLNLNLNLYRKISPKDFISLYSGLPLSFIPSFIREEQQKNNLLPSNCLKPLTKDDIFYEDIYPVETLVYSNKKEINNRNPTFMSGIIQTYKKLNPIHPIINCKIYLDDYASGVSSPDEALFEAANSQYKVVGRLLKVSLFNNMYKIFVGNAISIDCIYKKEYQDRWYFEDDDSKYNNNIIIRYNGKDLNDIDVVFEFVLVIQKKVEQKLYTVETSCGWCKIPMEYLQTSRKERLKINGGSPLGLSDISEIDIRKKRIGFIPKLATLFEGAIRSECPIKVKVFNDLSKDEKNIINYLPSLIVCHAAAMQMISLYRQELGEYILNHKDYLLKCIKDEYDLANMFCKIADVPDAFRVMNEIWKEIVIDGAPSGKKTDEDYLRFNFEKFVKKINSVLYLEKFKYNPLDPTELPRGDIKLMQDRDILLNSALRVGQDKKYNKLEYKMDDYSYKPFTIDEINGQKGNTILEKIDEMITLISK